MMYSTKIPLLVLAILFVWSAAGWGESPLLPEYVQSHFKSISSLNNYVFVKGRWNRTEGNVTSHKPPRINTVSMSCSKKDMTCKETIAELLTPEEIPGFDKPQLDIDETDYKILEWSNGTIRAVYAALVADFEIKISIKDEIAERSWRETKTRGVMSSNPNNFQKWILE